MTRQLTADIAVPSQCYLAEGPVWDAAARLLRWVDINPGHVHATAREALTPAQVATQPHAGDIFACDPGAAGRPPNLFAA
ncbi:MAG TPA: hypothetical protein VH021_16055 [Trebonia sp.]|jgi:sugar lactone lactonase YvrE|nr:hypothetical protein [Trebonia sp.]